MAARLIAQLIVSVGAVVGRAFFAAYKQAAANAAAQGGSAAREGGRSAADALTRRTGLTIDEACQILNVKKDADLAEVVKRLRFGRCTHSGLPFIYCSTSYSQHYEHLFKVNDSSIGGSLYLQSKVVRAKERFELELAEQAKNEGREPPEANKETPPSA
ncbi:hypothetical protein BC938DRAFT_481305 [Jimgerdemannia flammicorona]|uniref:Mitochondrial import inner membrane translocase subunit TIM16 n=1 Tax=Jimgerdemannia flammicorona TaxID=994334 RepID=A0A433QGK8_9FUNG|nr:hypothetical protein BC938DRAFT_481305 [Jimgerdemannia flammicorona]